MNEPLSTAAGPHPQLRSIGLLMMACSLICFLIAYERYVSAVATGRAIAEQLEGVDFVAVRTPWISLVALALGVTLLVAGGSCWWRWFREQRAAEKSLGG